MKKFSLFILTVFATIFCTNAQGSFSGYNVSSEGAWCWFADPRATHYENENGTINMSYIGYIDVHGNIKATQYNWLTGEKQDVLVRSYFQPDDHNSPTFLVLPDERVLIIYSRHTDEAAFYYRVSLKPGDITQLGEEKRLTTANKTTYPSPFIMSDDPTHWYLCWRGINWHPTIARLTMPDENGDCKFDWGPYQLVNSIVSTSGIRPYAKYCSNGKDKIYFSFTSTHPDNECPNWLNFAVVNINGGNQPTLHDIAGNKLSTISAGPYNVYKTSDFKNQHSAVVVDAPSNHRAWVWQVVLDKNNRPRIACVRITNDKSQHEYFYARWTGSKWALTDVCDGGGKFHPSNTERCYSGGEAIDPANPNIMYVSRPTQGTYGNIHEIWKYTINDSGTVTSSEQITKNSQKGNVRPYILNNSENSPLRLAWMNGDYQYWIVCQKYPNGYPTGIMCDYDWKAPETATPDGWTLSTTLTMDGSKYYGKLLDLGDITYSLDASTHRPSITINGTECKSQNQLYTSDAWQTCPSTTDGKSYYSILSTWNLTLTYNAVKKQLTTYRNGLIDQVIDVEITTVPTTVLSASAEVVNKCLPQQGVQKLLEAKVLEGLYVPATIITDIVLPSKVNGENVAWTSSNEDVLSANGTFKAPKTVMTITLTAKTANASRTFAVKAMPRNIEQNLIAKYDFESADGKTVADLSGRGNDLTLMGNSKVDGTLNLKSNTASGFSTNGYGLLPAAVMDSLRSYTILFEATPSSLSSAPRFYDFGYNSGNSLFCRANGFSAGIKYAGGTTTMTNSSTTLATGQTYKIAVTYEAATKTTCIYVNGELTGNGIENQNEPYLISLGNTCSRNYIGRAQWWDTSVASDNVDYVGTIDNFMMYNTTLTRKEVCQLQDVPFETGEYKTSFDNGDFEGKYTVLNGSGVTSDRAIYVPEGWKLNYSTRDEYDITALKSGDLYYGNFFATKAQCPDGGKQTLWVRQRWSASVLDYSQNVLLPEGRYTLTVNVFAASTSNASNKAYVYVDNDKRTTTAANTWQTLTFEFESDGLQPTLIGLQANHVSDEFICGFDNFKLEAHEPDAIITPIRSSVSTMRYTLDGRRATNRTRGIVIQGGKKTVQ